MTALRALAWCVCAAGSLRAILGPDRATWILCPAVTLAVGIAGWLADREADRRRADRWALRMQAQSHPLQSIDK